MAHVIFATPFDPRCKWFGTPADWTNITYTPLVDSTTINVVVTNGDTWISAMNSGTYHYADANNTDSGDWTEVNIPSVNSFGAFNDIDHFPDTGQFVGCGTNTNIWFIDADGTNATYIDRLAVFIPLGVTGTFRAVKVLGNTGAIIAMSGSDKKVVWSFDRGATWAAQTLGFNVSDGDIAWSPSVGGATYGRCLITKSDDVYYTDDGGATWNSYVYPGSTTNINSVTWDDSTNQFLIYDVLKRIYTSPDGITFTLLTTVSQWPSSGTQKIITNGQGHYVALTGSGGARVWTSQDLINWTERLDLGIGQFTTGAAGGECEWIVGGGGVGFSPMLFRSSTPTPIPVYSLETVHFNGIDDFMLSLDGLTTNDTQVVSGSFFLIHRDKTSPETILINTTPGNNKIDINVNGGVLTISLTDNTGNIKALQGEIPTNIWHHITFGFDISTGDGFLYYDDTQIDSAPPVGTSVDFSTSTSWRFGSLNISQNWANVCLSNFYLNFSTYIDFSNSANRRKFSDSNYIPIDLGVAGQDPTGSAPFMYLTGDSTYFHRNRGTGGDLQPMGTSPLYSCAFDIENPSFEAAHFSNAANDEMRTAGNWTYPGSPEVTTFRQATICITFLIESIIDTNQTNIFAGDRSFINKAFDQRFDVNFLQASFLAGVRMTVLDRIGTSYDDSGWLTALISFDTETGVRHIYFGDEKKTLSTNTSTLNADLTFTTADIILGSTGFNGCIHRVWMDLGNAMDFTVATNRRKFINADGSFVDLGDNGELPTGTPPIAYYKGDALTIQTNRGSGGQTLVPVNTQIHCEAAAPSDGAYDGNNSPRFSVLGPRSDNTLDIEPIVGVGSATFARNSVGYVRDWENVYRKQAVDEARFQGARIVENLCMYSEDPESRSTAFVKDTTVIGEQFTYAVGNFSYYQKNDMGAGTYDGDGATRTFICSVEIKLGTYNGPFGLRAICAGDETKSAISGLSTSEYKRVAVSITTSSYVTSNISLGFDNRSAVIPGVDTGIGTFYARKWLIEDATGRVDTSTPSEYSKTIGIDFVKKLYWNTNGNTITSNIVTEAQGIPLHPIVTKQEASVFARYAKRVNSTAYSVGDVRILASGSGTAGGNGYYYECAQAGTTAGSQGVFEENISEGDKVINGDFEIGGINNVSLPDGWQEDTNPISATRTQDDANTGNSSVRIVGGSNAGIEQTERFSVVAGRKYLIKFSAKLVSTDVGGTLFCRMGLRDGDGATNWDLAVDQALTLGVWVHHSEIVVSPAKTGNNAFIQYLRISNAVGSISTEMLVDSISVTEISDDNDVAWENKGHYKIAGYLGEPAVTNECPDSDDLTTWLDYVGTPVITADNAESYDGTITADKIQADATFSTGKQKILGTIADLTEYTISAIVEADDSLLSKITFGYSGGEHGGLQFAWSGGVPSTSTTFNVSNIVYDNFRDNLWRISFNCTTVSGKVAHNIVIHPDRNGTSKSIWFSGCNVTIGAVLYNPIKTTAGVLLKPADDLKYANTGNILDAEGTVFCSTAALDWDNVGGNLRIIGSDVSSSLLYYETTPRVTSYDGTTATFGPADGFVFSEQDYALVASRWSGSSKQITTRGISSVAGSYDGDWDMTDIQILSQAGSSFFLPAIISDIRIYTSDLGQTVAEELTVYD